MHPTSHPSISLSIYLFWGHMGIYESVEGALVGSFFPSIPLTCCHPQLPTTALVVCISPAPAIDTVENSGRRDGMQRSVGRESMKVYPFHSKDHGCKCGKRWGPCGGDPLSIPHALNPMPHLCVFTCLSLLLHVSFLCVSFPHCIFLSPPHRASAGTWAVNRLGVPGSQVTSWAA